MYKINAQNVMDEYGEQFYRELGLRPVKIKGVNEIVIAWIKSLNFDDYDTFTDFLMYSSNKAFISKNQLISLTKLNYFFKFGGNKKLIKIVNEFFDGKSVEIIKKLENDLTDECYSNEEQQDFEYALLGHYSLEFSVDKNYVLITQVEERNDDDYFMRTWSPRITMLFLSNESDQKIQRMKMPISVFQKYPLNEGDIVRLRSCKQQQKMNYNKEQNKFTIDPTRQEWWLNSFKPVSGDEFRQIASKGFLS